MILLDTNALIWLDQNHARTRRLLKSPEPLAVSPASILELHFLIEVGRLRLRAGSVSALIDDDRWIVDEAPSVQWFEGASEDAWTHDPFDRLIVAHGRLRRWKIATADGSMLEELRPSERLEL